MTNELQRWLKDTGWVPLRMGKGDHLIMVFPPTGARMSCPAGRALNKRELQNLRALARRGMRGPP